MPFLSHTDITTIAEPTRLTFRVERERGWLEWAIAIAGISFLFWEAHRFHSVFWLLFGIVGGGSLVTGLRATGSSELIVTSNELLVRSNLGGLFSKETSITPADITGIEYQSGGEDNPPGIYAKHGWRSQCLLSDLTRQQADEILDQIFRQFPHVGVGDTNPNSLLFGPSSDLTKLGLN
jgi:hypothetical protein